MQRRNIYEVEIVNWWLKHVLFYHSLENKNLLYLFFLITFSSTSTTIQFFALPLESPLMQCEESWMEQKLIIYEEKETLIVKLDKYVCIYSSYSPFFMHTHMKWIFTYKRDPYSIKFIYVAFYSFYHFFSCSFTRLMAVYVCMMPFSSPEKKIRRRNAMKIKEALRRKEEIWREKKTWFCFLLTYLEQRVKRAFFDSIKNWKFAEFT